MKTKLTFWRALCAAAIIAVASLGMTACDMGVTRIVTRSITLSHTIGNMHNVAQGAQGGGASQFMVAHRWTPPQLNSAGAAGGVLTHVEFVGNVRAATYSIMVWVGGSGHPLNPGLLVAQEIVPANTITEREWHRVRLSTPVRIPTNQELWIGYHVNTPHGFPTSRCIGPANSGFGNIIFWGNTWRLLEPQFNSNWMIRGIAEN